MCVIFITFIFEKQAAGAIRKAKRSRVRQIVWCPGERLPAVPYSVQKKSGGAHRAAASMEQT
jgi:hypothetical protein